MIFINSKDKIEVEEAQEVQNNIGTSKEINVDEDPDITEEQIEGETVNKGKQPELQMRKRNQREVKKPKWFDDYETSLIAVNEELTYSEAMNSENAKN